MVAGSLHLDGQVLSNGGIAGGGNHAAGSGGGIYVNVGSLTGNGSIRAAGANDGGTVGTGGGGRIAIYAQEYSGFDLTKVTAPGGTLGIPGGAGTVYVRDTDNAVGTLVIDGTGGGGAGYTALGLPGANTFTVPGPVIIRGAQTVVRPEHSGMRLIFEGGLKVEQHARLEVDSIVQLNGGVTVASGGRFESLGRITATMPVVIDAGTLVGERIEAPSLELTGGSLLTHAPCIATVTHKLEVNVTGAITVSTDSRIDVSGKGYLAGRTTGNTTVGASTGFNGGSYGGLGGAFPPGQVCAVYGDYLDPADWGSGGGLGSGERLSAGGGLVRLAAGVLNLEGQVSANGGITVGGNHAAGSGGGIYIGVGTIVGSGSIRAAGANDGGTVGTGGGGRIALYAQNYSGFDLAKVTAPGGTLGVPGEAGTVYFLNGRAPTRAHVFAPVASNGNYVRQLDSVTLWFSRPINLNSLTASAFQIVGPLGSVVTGVPVEATSATYQIPFTAQTANGTYRFTLAPTVLDGEGFQMDQNANGTAGEAGDGFSFTLILDTVYPRVTQHSLAGDIAGTVSSADVWFSETIDRTTFTVADVSILNPANGNVTVSSISEVGLNRFRITFPAQTATGTYHVRVGPDVLDLAGNPLDQDRDGVGGEATDDVYDALFNLVPVDLELSEVTPNANQFTAGDSYNVSWKGRNTTGAPLIGNWIDAVYLSPDPFWNITDTRLGTVQHTGGLAANEVYSASASFNVPGVLPGNYYLLVRADIGNETRETVETNNVVAFGPIPVTVRSVAIGGSVTGALTASNRQNYFAITVPGGESLRLTLTGPAGINQLFVNFASIPTALSPDFSGTTTGTGQTVTLTGGPSGGTYYVLVSGDQIGGGTHTYTLTTDTASFFVTDVSPKRASANVYFEGFQPMPTITITGAGFSDSMAVEFIGSGGQVRVPQRTQFISSTTLRVDLDTTTWTRDTYDVRVTKSGTGRLLADAFTLDIGFSALRASLVVPSALSPGYPTRQTIWIEYENAGQAAMVAPILHVSANGNAVLTDNPATAISARTSSAEAAALGSSLQVMAAGSGATPGILQAGDRGRIPIYYLGLRPDSGIGGLSIQLSSVQAVKTRLNLSAGGIEIVPRRMNQGPVVEEQARPETVALDAWSAVWENLTIDLITDFGPYVTRLAGHMDYLAAIGQRTTSVPKLFNFAVLQASAGLHPVRTLAGAVDASVPSPGFPLVFRRIYGQPMLSRYKLGALGRGWTHNWDISIQELQKTAGVVVHGPNGADRFFSRSASGTFTAAAGDTGKLTVAGGLFRLAEADGTVWQFRSQNLLDYVDDPNGNRITCGYSGALLASLTHSSGKQILLAYNGAGRIVGVTDPVGAGAGDDRVTAYEYDGTGAHLVRVTAPGNRVTTYSYQTAGAAPGLHALTRIVHPDLTENSFTYDAQGRLTETDGNCCGGAQRVTYGFDSAGDGCHGASDAAFLRARRAACAGARWGGADGQFWLQR